MVGWLGCVLNVAKNKWQRLAVSIWSRVYCLPKYQFLHLSRLQAEIRHALLTRIACSCHRSCKYNLGGHTMSFADAFTEMHSTLSLDTTRSNKASLPDGVRHIEQLHSTTEAQISEAIHFPRSFTLANMAPYFYEKLNREREEGRFLRLLHIKMPDKVTIDIFHAYCYWDSSLDSGSESLSAEASQAEIDRHMMARDVPENISVKDVDAHLSRGVGILTLEKPYLPCQGVDRLSYGDRQN